jgi:hypothetical protein
MRAATGALLIVILSRFPHGLVQSVPVWLPDPPQRPGDWFPFLAEAGGLTPAPLSVLYTKWLELVEPSWLYSVPLVLWVRRNALSSTQHLDHPRTLQQAC